MKRSTTRSTQKFWISNPKQKTKGKKQRREKRNIAPRVAPVLYTIKVINKPSLHLQENNLAQVSQ